MGNDIVTNLTIPVPAFMSTGLGEAAEKYKMSKSDIIRSILYDFLVSSGITKQDRLFDSFEDVIVSPE